MGSGRSGAGSDRARRRRSASWVPAVQCPLENRPLSVCPIATVPRSRRPSFGGRSLADLPSETGPLFRPDNARPHPRAHYLHRHAKRRATCPRMSDNCLTPTRQLDRLSPSGWQCSGSCPALDRVRSFGHTPILSTSTRPHMRCCRSGQTRAGRTSENRREQGKGKARKGWRGGQSDVPSTRRTNADLSFGSVHRPVSSRGHGLVSGVERKRKAGFGRRFTSSPVLNGRTGERPPEFWRRGPPICTSVFQPPPSCWTALDRGAHRSVHPPSASSSSAVSTSDPTAPAKARRPQDDPDQGPTPWRAGRANTPPSTLQPVSHPFPVVVCGR